MSEIENLNIEEVSRFYFDLKPNWFWLQFNFPITILKNLAISIKNLYNFAIYSIHLQIHILHYLKLFLLGHLHFLCKFLLWNWFWLDECSFLFVRAIGITVEIIPFFLFFNQFRFFLYKQLELLSFPKPYQLIDTEDRTPIFIFTQSFLLWNFFNWRIIALKPPILLFLKFCVIALNPFFSVCNVVSTFPSPIIKTIWNHFIVGVKIFTILKKQTFRHHSNFIVNNY